MRILILGSNGFIGRNVKEYLWQFPSYKLLCPSRAQLDLLNEAAVCEYLKSTCPDVVINAAVCRNPSYFESTSQECELGQDLKMFYILDKYSRYYGKMLYFGSGAEFDKNKDIASVRETDFLNGIPSTQYGLAKYVIGRSIDKSDSIYNLRIFGLFGKYENWKTTFISGACCKAIKGIPITIRKNTYFDYLVIDDFCPVIRWFIEHKPQYHTYNVCSGEKRDLLSIAETVKRLSGNDVPIYVCQEGLANEYTASNERLKQEYLGFSLTRFDSSIIKLLSYYRSIENEIDLLSLLY